MTRLRHRQQHRAFSIVEIVFSILLVGGVLVTALNSAGAAITSRHSAEGRVRGQLIAESLMTEILAQAYIDEEKPTTLGLDTGEADPSHRKNFDDVDDYRNYTDSPPTIRSGDPIPGFANWTRFVSVVIVAPASPNDLALSDSGVKRIKITVECNGVPVATLFGFKTSTDPVAGKSKEILVKTLDIVLEPVVEIVVIE